ncbi:hypothetical protein M9458_008541, partial [Cirrhinus mrigala]
IISFGAEEDDDLDEAMSLTASLKDWAQASEECSEVEGHAAFQDELVRILTRAVSDLGLEWEKADEPARSKLYSWFLDSGHRAATPRKRAPFLPDLHDEVAKAWAAPQSAQTHAGGSEIFTEVNGAEARGYMRVPPAEESIAAHLCPSSASLNRAAVSALHTMAVLHVFQAQLLKSLDEGKEDPEAFKDLRTAMDFALKATKKTAQAIGRSLGYIVVLHRHLWLSLTELKDADRRALPVSLSGLFGDAVETIAEHFSEAQKRSRVMSHFLPRWAGLQHSLNHEVDLCLLRTAAPPPAHRYFVIPKKGGGLHPILDFRPINHALYKRAFKMTMLKQILGQIQPGDWFVSVDLKDAYFHIQIAPRHRHFLRFALDGTAYQFSVMPFGLALAPRIFMKCVDAALSPSESEGDARFELFGQLADFGPFRGCSQQPQTLLRPGPLRERTEERVMSQTVDYVFGGASGLGLNESASVSGAYSRFNVSSGYFQPGAASSAERISEAPGQDGGSRYSVPPQSALYAPPSDMRAWRTGRARIVVTRKCLNALEPWQDPDLYHHSVQLGLVTRRKVVTTDVSTAGWEVDLFATEVVLLSVSLPSGRGRAHNAVAESPSVCIPPVKDFAASAAKTQGGESVGAVNSPVLAEQTVVSRSAGTTSSSPMADPAETGPPVSGELLDMAPKP